MGEATVKKPIKSGRTRKKTGPYRDKEFKMFAAFLACTMGERREKFGFTSDKEFAAKFKLSHDTLTEWKKRDDLWELRDKNLVMLKQFTLEVLEGVRNKAIMGDPRAAEIWLMFVEKWNKKFDISAGIEMIGNETDDYG